MEGKEVIDIFDSFIARLKAGLIHANHHFMPQTSLMLFRPDELDFVGKVETFEEDLNFVLKKIFCESKEVVTWAPHAAETGVRPRGVRMKAEFLTNSQKSLLVDLYRQDFELLNYKPW